MLRVACSEASTLTALLEGRCRWIIDVLEAQPPLRGSTEGGIVFEAELLKSPQGGSVVVNTRFVLCVEHIRLKTKVQVCCVV
jgi:hypothetical protein